VGDFGVELCDRIGCDQKNYYETRSNGSDEWRQLLRVVPWEGPALVNIGLTAWGRSGARNFLGYLALSLRVRRGKKTIVLVHNLIEATDSDTTGYPISPLVRAGAHRAISMLKGADLVVFSRTIADALQSQYGLRPALVTPIPCLPDRRGGPPSGPVPSVITPGYFNPYKGHERIPDVKALLPGNVRFVVVGGPHRVLMETDETYRSRFESLRTLLTEGAIEVKGRVSDSELDQLISSASVALLPYTSTQGASATLSRIASVGTPVVAPRLAEFEWLQGLGAGILLTPPSVEGLADGIRRVMSEPRVREELAGRQRVFAARYSWEEFIKQLHTLVLG
jgi:glycosyltransferase involved in cell wall biosynthesis